VCIGVKEEGFREVLGVVEGAKEDKESWLSFLRHMKTRGLRDVDLAVSDKCLGLVEALGEVYPEARWQHCVVHLYRNVFTATPRGKIMVLAAIKGDPRPRKPEGSRGQDQGGSGQAGENEASQDGQDGA
jgi:putative transposase